LLTIALEKFPIFKVCFLNRTTQEFQFLRCVTTRLEKLAQYLLMQSNDEIGLLVNSQI